ncbi:hypothetical protein DFH09DRAFT_1479477 [Mycena vulgaris]|nr:hypothetical protein DFH09DRAFT_1479477 [Mycena vulgaris]
MPALLIPIPSIATMPPTRSARLRDSAPPFNVPGRKSMFSRARGLTINGGTFNSQPIEPPSLPNRLSRYVEHREARLAELEDLINVSMEKNPYNQPVYGDETGASELVVASLSAADLGRCYTQGAVATEVRDPCSIYHSNFAERLQTEDSLFVRDGASSSTSRIQS